MGIIGAILGDISGSQFEFHRCRNPKTAELFTKRCKFTDDTVMSLAVKYAIDHQGPPVGELKAQIDYYSAMHEIGRKYMNAGYGRRFYKWMLDDDPAPYNSFGNGSAMRVSYVGEHFDDEDRVISEAAFSAMPSHNHPEGVKGAVVTAYCIWMAKHEASKQEIFDYVLHNYPVEDYRYSIYHSLDEIRQRYIWNETCQGSVPVAMRCFYESEDYESFLRNVFSLDCDSDTLGAIGGAVAEEYYKTTGLDNEKIINTYLDDYLKNILRSH